MRLRTRLTLLATGVVAVALVVGAFALAAVISAGRVAALDAVVRTRVDVVAQLVAQDRLPTALPVAEPGEIAQVLDAGGHVLATSPNASSTLPLLPADEVARLRAQADLAAVGTVLVATSEHGAYDGQVRVGVRALTYRDAPVTVVASVPLSEVRGVVHALRVALVGVVPALTALLAATFWVVLGRALAPVEQLRAAAAEVARAGGPGSLPVPRRDDELAALARTLNEMLDRLEAAAARQRSFVADAAHELRSPLAAVRASVEVAAAHPQSFPADELAAELAPVVLRMGRLTDDLLLLARVGATTRRPQRLDLAALAREVVGADAVRGAGTAVGDVDAVSRVLRNLVENATRYGRVEVVVAPGRVDVDDDGPGIPAADRERVLERFVRLDEARERDAGGSGLGLAIARELAREGGGDVVLDRSPAGGLRATVTLPVD